MAQFCIDLKDNIEFKAYLSNFEKAMLGFAKEFGEKCSVFSTVDSFLGDFKEDAENAIKDTLDAASSIYKEIVKAQKELKHLTQEGVNAIISAINTIDSVIAEINATIGKVMEMIAESANALASAACNLLNSSITGLPSDVKIQSASILAKQFLDPKKPKKFVADMMKELGVNNLKDTMRQSANKLKNLPKFADFQKHICIPTP